MRSIWEAVKKKFSGRAGLAALFAASGAFIAGGWLWAYRALRGAATPLILHFTSFSGIDRIGTIADVHGIGILGAVALFVNAMIGLALEMRDKALSRLVALATFFLAALLFILFAVIIQVN